MVELQIWIWEGMSLIIYDSTPHNFPSRRSWYLEPASASQPTLSKVQLPRFLFLSCHLRLPDLEVRFRLVFLDFADDLLLCLVLILVLSAKGCTRQWICRKFEEEQGY